MEWEDDPIVGFPSETQPDQGQTHEPLPTVHPYSKVVLSSYGLKTPGVGGDVTASVDWVGAPLRSSLADQSR